MQATPSAPMSSTSADVARFVRNAFDTHSISGGYFGGTSPGQRRTMDLTAALEHIAADPPVEERRRR